MHSIAFMVWTLKMSLLLFFGKLYFPTRKLEIIILLVFTVRAGSKVFVPKGVDDAQDGEPRGDHHKALVPHGGTLWRDVLVLAPFEHSFVNTVQADAVRVGLSRNLVKLGG